VREPNRYELIIEKIFHARYVDGVREIEFERKDIERVAQELGIVLPKNIGDVIYSFRYRAQLPESIRSLLAPGEIWIIQPAGRSKYRFMAVKESRLVPSEMLAVTKIPDATPGIISMYALNDEQALLAKLRYNRLVDIFTGVTCYSLQNHLRTTVPALGQVETDEVYVGVDHRGAHFVFPVQAKGGKDKLSIVQIEQDYALCAVKFSGLICRPIAAQFLSADTIVLFDFEKNESGLAVTSEKHYRLVSPDQMTPEDLAAYRDRKVPL